MARLIYSAIMSLDGYIADADGRFEWGGGLDGKVVADALIGAYAVHSASVLQRTARP